MWENQQPSWDPVGTVLEQGTKAGTALTVGEIAAAVTSFLHRHPMGT